jgi:hypothetical protein
MVWVAGDGKLQAKRLHEFRFRMEDAQGKPADDVELYMGMLGHAAFVSVDRTVFAHVHPSGSAPMPAIALAQPDNPHAGHTMMQPGTSVEAVFPYGFPKPGRYRIFVQMKRAGEVSTGIFETDVEP